MYSLVHAEGVLGAQILADTLLVDILRVVGRGGGLGCLSKACSKARMAASVVSTFDTSSILLSANPAS